MKLTNVGKWLMESFLNKNVENGDYPLSTLICILEDIQNKNDIEHPEMLPIAQQLGLVK